MDLSRQASLRVGAYHPSAASRAAVARGVLLLGLVSPWLRFSPKTTDFVQPALPRQNRWLRAQVSPTLAAPGFLTRRTPRLFARPLAIRRQGTTTRPIPAMSAPLVANPFGTPSAGDTPVVLLLDHGFCLPVSVAHERPLDSGSERIEEELRHLVESLVHVLDVRDEDVLSHSASEPRGGEVGRREDDRGHVPPACVGHDADVLEAVALLHEPDRLLDPPSREVALDDLPERLVGVVGPVLSLGLRLLVDREVGEEHHGLPSEPLDDDEAQLLVAPRESHGHRPELDQLVRLLAVRVELHDGLVAHDALAREPFV